MRKRLLKAVVAVGVIALLVCASAYAISIEIDKVVVSSTASITPRSLPSRGNTPVSVSSITRIKRSDGAQPPALKALTFLFDGNGTIDTKGLPTCSLAKLAGTTPKAARQRCAGAIVGEGVAKAD